MTRINCVSVEELTNNFILAEYFELPRLFPLIRKAAAKNDREIPDTYRMGEGHMRFFYDKLSYLVRRFERLAQEAVRRGLPAKVDPNVSAEDINIQYHTAGIDSFYWKDWEPSQEDMQLNRNRLQYRRRYEGGIYD